jgi:hypothetical protein
VVKTGRFGKMENKKKIDLFLRQKDTLDKFLERGAISQM